MNRIFTLHPDNNCIKVDYNYTPGHRFGQGQLSPDSKFNFIHIPKNASSEIKRILPDWTESDYHTINFPIEHLVILRDPTDRWISGIAEFLVGNYSYIGNCNSEISVNEVDAVMSTQVFQNLLFNFVIFDSHTIPQCCFLDSIDLASVTFFYYDDLVIPRLFDYVGLDTRKIKNTNSSLTNPKKLVIINKLKQLLEENSNLQHSIDKHYYADHVLFDKVKFQY